MRPHEIQKLCDRAADLGLYVEPALIESGWKPGKPRYAGTPCLHCQQEVKGGLCHPQIPLTWFHSACVRPWQAVRQAEAQVARRRDHLEDLRKELAWRTPLANDRWGPMPACNGPSPRDPDDPWWQAPERPATYWEALDESHHLWWCIAELYAQRVRDLAARIAALELELGTEAQP